MATTILANDIKYKGHVLRAGHPIDDVQYDAVSIAAAGGVLLTAGSDTNAGSAAAIAQRNFGQGAQVAEATMLAAGVKAAT